LRGLILEYVSIVIALVSLAASIYIGLKSQRLEKNNTDLQRRLVEIEESRDKDRQKAISKAQLRASIENHGRHNYRLVIENAGNSEARNVRIKMDGKPINEHPSSVAGDHEINLIGPHSQATRMLALTFRCSPPFDFEAS
jgi:hypothetical protein